MPDFTALAIWTSSAEANTSAAAPFSIWVRRPDEGPKLNTTWAPGFCASKSRPISVKASVSDAAAYTRSSPSTPGDALAVAALLFVIGAAERFARSASQANKRSHDRTRALNGTARRSGARGHLEPTKSAFPIVRWPDGMRPLGALSTILASVLCIRDQRGDWDERGREAGARVGQML